jgi:hypothetical protein
LRKLRAVLQVLYWASAGNCGNEPRNATNGKVKALFWTSMGHPGRDSQAMVQMMQMDSLVLSRQPVAAHTVDRP